MLIEFTVKNYRSFRDEAVLSMEATGASTLKKRVYSIWRNADSAGCCDLRKERWR